MVSAYVKALSDEDPTVQIWTAHALGGIRLEAKAAVPALVELLKHTDDRVRKAAAAALKNIDPEAAPDAIKE